MFTVWSFRRGIVAPVAESRVAETTRRILFAGQLPPSERHDAFILTEAALLDCLLLVTDDSELRGVDLRRLGMEFAAFGLRPPTIVTSRELLRYCR